MKRMVMLVLASAGCGSSTGGPTVLASGFFDPFHLAQDRDSLFVDMMSTQANPAAGMFRVDKHTGDETQLSAHYVFALVADDAGAYWIEASGTTTAALVALPAGASAPITMGQAVGESLALDPTYLYFLDPDGAVARLARGSGNNQAETVGMAGAGNTSGELVADPGGDGVWCRTMFGVTHFFADTTKPPLETTLGMETPPDYLVLSTGEIVSGGDGGGLGRWTTQSNIETEVLISNVAEPSALALVGDTIFLVDDAKRVLVSLPGDSPDVATTRVDPAHTYAHVGSVGAIIADDANLYWTDRDGGNVYALAR